MTRTSTVDIHDALFKATFSRLDHAAGELRSVLPPDLVAALDFDTLALEPGSYVDKNLKKRFSDLLFSAHLIGEDGKRLFIYVLFEHTSRADPLMPFRLLRYTVDIWSRYLGDHPGTRTLPAVVPVVVHHGMTPWRWATDLLQLIALPAELMPLVRRHLPAFEFILDDLSARSDADLRDRDMAPAARLVLAALARARSMSATEFLDRWLAFVDRVLVDTDGRQLVSMVLFYLSRIEGVSFKTLAEQVQQAVAMYPDYTNVSQMADLLLDEESKNEWRREGRDLGLREGRLEGRRETLVELLTLRFGPPAAEIISRIDTASDDAITHWLSRMLRASTLEEIFETQLGTENR